MHWLRYLKSAAIARMHKASGKSLAVEELAYQIYLISFYFTSDIIIYYTSLSVDAYIPDKNCYDAVFFGTYHFGFWDCL